MKILFDKEKCKLHAQCRGAAPELFSFANDGSLGSRRLPRASDFHRRVTLRV